MFNIGQNMFNMLQKTGPFQVLSGLKNKKNQHKT